MTVWQSLQLKAPNNQATSCSQFKVWSGQNVMSQPHTQLKICCGFWDAPAIDVAGPLSGGGEPNELQPIHLMRKLGGLGCAPGFATAARWKNNQQVRSSRIMRATYLSVGPSVGSRSAVTRRSSLAPLSSTIPVQGLSCSGWPLLIKTSSPALHRAALFMCQA